MSVTADSVVVDLIANNGQYDATVTRSADNFDNAAKRTIKAANDVERSATRVGNATRNLGFQLGDIGTQLGSQTSPFLIIAQQGPQVVDALRDISESGATLGQVMKSIALPGALGLLAALTPLIAKLFETGEAGRGAKPGIDAFSNSLIDLKARADEAQRSLTELNQTASAQRVTAISQANIDVLLAQGNVARLRKEIAALSTTSSGRGANFGENFANERRIELLQKELDLNQDIIDRRSLQRDLLVKQDEQIRASEKAARDAAQSKKDEIAARKANAAAMKEEREQLRELQRLQTNLEALEKKFDPGAASARAFADTMAKIDELDQKGILDETEATVFRIGAALERLNFKPITAKDIYASDPLAEQRQLLQQEGEARERQRNDDFRERASDIRSLADLYRSAFENGAKSIGQALKEALLDAIVTALARQTIGAFAGLIGGGGVGGFIGKAIFGRASGGYAAPRSLHRVNETAGGVELLRMGPTGGQVIPLGQSQASPRGGGTTVLQTIAVDARGAVMNREFAAMILAQAEQRAVQLDAVSGKAVYNATPQRLQQQNLLGS